MSKRSFELPAEKGVQKIDPETGKAQQIPSLPLVCERIRYYREKNRLEQKEMAKLLGITGNSISNWETGRSRPDINLLPAICRILDISLYELFNIEQPAETLTDKQKELIKKYEALSKGHRYAVDKLIESLAMTEDAENIPDLKVLLYFNKSLAAGTGDPTEYEEDAKPVYVYSTPEVSRADSIFKVNGDSMEPAFSDGQDVLVQRITGDSALEPGEIGAFIVGNETYIKRYEKDGLHSINPDYPVMHFRSDESVFLIGRVLGIFSPKGYAKEKDIEKYKHFSKIK